MWNLRLPFISSTTTITTTTTVTTQHQLDAQDLRLAAFLLSRAAESAESPGTHSAEDFYKEALVGLLRAARDENGIVGERATNMLVTALSQAQGHEPAPEPSTVVESALGWVQWIKSSTFVQSVASHAQDRFNELDKLYDVRMALHKIRP
jgi:hypothetical protein